MNHEEVRRRITESASDTLTGDAARAVEVHLAECADCRGWQRAFDLALLGARLETMTNSHPESERLARFVVDPESLDSGERERIRGHVERCDACRAEGAAVAAALAEAGRLGERSALRPAWRPRLAAALAGAALASALWWGIDERRSAVEGAQPVVWIGPVERGGAAGARGPSAGAESLFVALAPTADGIAAGEALRLVLLDSSTGESLWTIELDNDGSRTELATTGFVLVAIPAPPLAGRTTKLRLLSVAPGGATRTLLEQTFTPR